MLLRQFWVHIRDNQRKRNQLFSRRGLIVLRLDLSVFSLGWPMEDRTESPRAVKVEEHSRCVILTYFHGDAENMVDAHFNRALGKAPKAKAPAARTKKHPKIIKLGKHMKSTLCDLPDNKQGTLSLSQPHHSNSLFFWCRKQRPLSGCRCRVLYRATAPSSTRTPLELQPCGQHSQPMALIQCQSSRGPSFTIPRILHTPGGPEHDWTGIRHIPAQPAA